ncbi:MAG: hypothetical protein ACK42H_11620 [Planctomycetota bacterium]|jgi:ribosomal protein S27AE
MARSIERRICGDCGATVNKKFHDCPKCGALIPTRRRHINTPTVDPECDGVRETYRSLSSRLGEGFGMMNDGFEWIDRVFDDERTPACYDEPDED